MLKYFKRKSPERGEGNSQSSKQSCAEINVIDMNHSVVINIAGVPSNRIHVEINEADLPSNPIHVEINLAHLPSNPGLRRHMLDYHPNDRDQVRRAYLQKGPCQPYDHQFPQTQFGPKLRRFNKMWFRKFPTWLEYSVAKDAAYCLCCYLFKPEIGEQSGGESFVGEGFSNWKKNERIQVHVGGPNSAHNQAWGKCQDLVNQRQRIQTVFDNQSNQTRTMYRIRLNASINCIRFLLKQGLPNCIRFSAMNIVKNRLRNRMSDQWLNASLVVYIERDVFAGIDNETIMRYFQNMRTRRGQL